MIWRAAVFLSLLALCGCITNGQGSVTNGECKVFDAPVYAIRGATQHDQDWIDPTIESGVGGCKWTRPAPRPAEWDAAQPVRKVVAKVKPKKKPLWIRMLQFHKKPAPVVAPPPVAEPLPPAPRSAVDELLQPSDAK